MKGTHLESTPRRKRAGGFTVTEVVVVLAIGSIAFLSFYTGIGQGFSTSHRARHKLRATQVLLERLEVIRVYNWTQINTPGFIPPTFTENNAGIDYNGTIVVTDSGVHPAYTNTMRKIVGEISWVYGGLTNRQRMETLISEHGIQNYVY